MAKRGRTGAGGMRRSLKRARTGTGAGGKRMSIARSPAMPMIKIKRTTVGGAWTAGTASVGDFWRYYQPNVSQFNNFGEFSALFDMYKVNGIKYTFYPRYDSIDGNPTTFTNTTVKMLTCVDPFTSLVPTGVYGTATMNVLMEQSGLKVRNGLRPVSVYFRPQVEIPSNVGGGVTYTPSSKVWINTSSTGVPFRGFHVAIATNNLSTPSGLVYDVYITWYITFKNLK